MRIHLLAVGNRMPDWINAGYAEYARRMSPECELVLREINPGRRSGQGDVQRAMKQEAERIQAAIPKNAHIVCLEVEGESWSTAQLAGQMKRWLGSGREPCLLVGGPDGLPAVIRTLAHHRWSLSALTFPHPLVRVLVAEQLYRALSILRGHPYHREG